VRLLHTPERPGDQFEIDGSLLGDGECAEVTKARGEELLARYPRKLALAGDNTTTEEPDSPADPILAQSAPDTAPADQGVTD
jgi:hypothetical protein